MKIGSINIGPGQAPFVIAEAGINHNGDLKKALKMVSVAKKAEANAIKFQTFKAEQFVKDSKLTMTYRSKGTEVTESQLEMFKRHEFSIDNWFKIKADKQIMKYIVYKGSVAVDGISLTIAECNEGSFSVAIIPHTFECTTLNNKEVDSSVNLEVDMIGKYIEKLVSPYIDLKE